MKFFRKFRHAWRAALSPDYILDADFPGYWTPGDASSLLGFLRSESGRKLNQLLKNYILKSAVDACNGRITKGQARGIASTVALIDAYLPAPEEVIEIEPEKGTEAEREAAFLAEYGLE